MPASIAFLLTVPDMKKSPLWQAVLVEHIQTPPSPSRPLHMPADCATERPCSVPETP